MFLAFAVLMLQIPAIPQFLSLSAATPAVETARTLPSETTAAPETNSSVTPTSTSEPAAEESSPADMDAQPTLAVAYTPGVLTPEPVAPAGFAAAQPVALPSSPVPVAFQSTKSEPPVSAADYRNARRLWLGLSIAQHSAAAFDAWSTRRVVASGAGQELNLVLRPFAGNASLYAAVQVAPAILDYVSHRMMYSNHAWARRTWWVPQALGTVMSIASGVHNLGVYNAR